MPNRILRDAILTSERVASLGWATEVFYRRLHSIVDDYGRHEAGHQLLRAKCYPLQTDSVRVADIARWMAECQKSGLILVYGANGKQYLEVCDFGQQLRSASKCPAPPANASHVQPLLAIDSNCEQPPANEHLGVSVSVDVSESVSESVPPARKRATRAAKTSLPDGFALSERVKTWAAGKGYDRLDEHFESFVGKAKAKGYVYTDWDEGLMGAIREDWAQLRGRTRGGPAKHGDFDNRDYGQGGSL